MWSRLAFAIPKAVAPQHFKMQALALRQLSMPSLVVGSIANHQIHNLLELIKTNQMTEQGLSELVAKGLLSLMGQTWPLVNLTSQICTARTCQ